MAAYWPLTTQMELCYNKYREKLSVEQSSRANRSEVFCTHPSNQTTVPEKPYRSSFFVRIKVCGENEMPIPCPIRVHK
jgi:hypothetical protein